MEYFGKQDRLTESYEKNKVLDTRGRIKSDHAAYVLRPYNRWFVLPKFLQPVQILYQDLFFHIYYLKNRVTLR